MNDSNPDEVTVDPDGNPISQVDSPDPDHIGRYRIERRLGRGGFGLVFLAYDEHLERNVAVKVPHANLISGPEDVQGYLAEARAVASLDHPGIVPVHDVGTAPDCPFFIVSKYIKGTDLRTSLKQQRLRYSEAAELIATVAEALHYAHKQGLVHRDVKPANILIDGAGEPYVVDFGLALREDSIGTGPWCAGTPAYMSPEQARGEGHRVDGRSDIFSLGVVFYELLAGRRPFRGDTQTDILERVTRYEPRPLRQYDEKMPKELERICHKALAKRASERYSSAHDMAEDLRVFLADETAVPSGTATGGIAPIDSGSHSTPNSTSSTSNSRLMTSDSATSESIALVSVAGSSPIKVVPRGLRSFDAHDADFFLELLPGPRDRAGLPDSVQFWKTRIEESDPDKTFSVGLIYGPSGCGKSSLMKAGLLPRLSEDIISVYIEATPEETETRLLRGLRKSCPALDEKLNLHGTLAALRRGQGIPVGRKVLIVLDQFEQWLHAKKDEHDTELVRALRQCDGGRVQCVLLVRDDFWLAVSRLLRDLEVPLVEGHNIALADLFDIDHARKVLAAFGRAFGKLPDDVGETTKENKEFLKRSVAGLAQDGKVICVRLALFADMMKGRPWTPAALKEVGGTTGVGVTFLEETFASASASPQHRLHQQAARSVLKDLIPGSGLDIKGHMRSRTDLLAVSGYQNRSADFEELIRILDSEIRLITPTDPEGLDSDTATETESGKKYFQLAHDYLVPSLRDWLTRKQKETYRGRAELRLTERATLWNARPENRRLPAWWEYLNIVGLTRRQNWSEPERAMMQKAGQFHGLRGVIGLTVAVLLMFGGLRLRQNIQQGQEAVRQESIQKERTVRAEELVRGLVYADIGRIDDIILQLEPYQDLTQPLLQEQWDAAEDGGPQKLNLSLGLLSNDPEQVAYLSQQLLRAHPEEFPVIRDALTEHAGPLATAFWDELDANDDSANGDSEKQLRAAAALATWDSSNAQWESIADAVAAQLCAVPVSFLRDWKEAYRPVYPRLLEPLTEIYRDVDQDGLARSMAASLLADYAGKDPERLAGLISIANRKQFDVIYPVISKLGDEAVQQLTAIIEQEIRPGWNDAAADPKWSLVPQAAADAMDSAGGLLTDQYAFCMTMKWQQCLDMTETLRSSGYRPVRFRPYAIRDELQVAATWIRDGQDWQIHSDLTDEQLRTKDAELRKANFAPIDVAGYVVRGSVESAANRFAAIWGPADDSEVRMYSGTPADAERMLFADMWAADGFDVRARSAFTANGTTYRSAIWTKNGDHKTSASKLFSGDHSQFSGEIYPGLLLTDISVEQSAEPTDRQQQYSQRLGLLEEVLAERKDEVVFRKALATVRFQLGKDAEALADLDWLIEQSPDDVRLFQLRSMLHARGQDAAAARQDLTRCRDLYKDDIHYLYLEVVVDAYLGDDVAAIEKLEEQIASDPENGVLLYNATCAFALLADMFTTEDEKKSAQLLQRGLALLEQTIAAGYDNFDHIRQDSDVDALRGDPRFQTLLQIDHTQLQYTAAWNPNPNFESQELHGLSLEAHSRRFRQLIIDGYRPVAVSAMAAPTDNTLAAASIWMRPRASYAVKEELNKKKAQAGAALLRMNAGGSVWPLLAHSTEPGARSYLIHGLKPFAVKPQIIIDRLAEETDVSARRALLLALGEFDFQRWPADEQKKMTDELLATFVEDPNAGIHAAAEWVLRRWGHSEELTKRTRDFATGEPQGDRQWYITGQEQTVVLIPGPIEFLMGSPVDEVGREDQLRGHFEELHPQGIERSFAIMSHEITVDQYLKWKPDFDYNEKFAREGSAPMTRISWFEAAEYCNWLSEQEGIPEDQWCYRPNESGKYAQGMSAVADFLERTGYRLPTEAEWEYACGAGALTSRYFGDTEDLLGEYVWCSRHSKDRWMLPAGSLKPNDFGLFDMLGNAWEWCNDESRYFSIPTSGEARKDLPVIKNVLDTQRQCMRGGSFLAQPAEARTSRRFRYTPTFHNYSVGMRVARTIP